METLAIEPATERDVAAIISVLTPNRHDGGLFQEPKSEVQSNVGDFLVARDLSRRVVGCTALHRHTATCTEILGVAVLPELQGQGIGMRLVREWEQISKAERIEQLWLATIKPTYFARLGYEKFSRWELPTRVL